jgi:hypothetical protein
MQSTVNQRIKTFQETIGTQRFFCQKIGIKETTLSSLFKEHATLPSFMVLEGILKAFPEIDARWLILGEGKMMNKYEYLEFNRLNEDSIEYGKMKGTEGGMERMERRITELENNEREILKRMEELEIRINTEK